MKYPVYRPEITSAERANVNACLDSTWISSKGRFIQLFEKGIEQYTGAQHAISVFNGTVALHLSLTALNIQPGDEIIVSDFSYIASSNAVHYVQAIPVFVDVDMRDWNISIEAIKKAYTPRTKAILFTNIYGQIPIDIHEILAFADSKGIFVIEDAAESIGAGVGARNSGTLGTISTFSFFGNKTITTGEGGMVLTSDEVLDNMMRKLKNQGNSETRRYYHDLLGFNFRMTNIQAAIGCAQLDRIEKIIERKQEIFLQYKNGLGDVFQFQESPPGFRSSHWMNGFLCRTGEEKKVLEEKLAASGIETRPFFPPMSSMPFNQSILNKNTIELYQRGIILPSYHLLTNQDLDYIITQVRNNI